MELGHHGILYGERPRPVLAKGRCEYCIVVSYLTFFKTDVDLISLDAKRKKAMLAGIESTSAKSQFKKVIKEWEEQGSQRVPKFSDNFIDFVSKVR